MLAGHQPQKGPHVRRHLRMKVASCHVAWSEAAAICTAKADPTFQRRPPTRQCELEATRSGRRAEHDTNPILREGRGIVIEMRDYTRLDCLPTLVGCACFSRLEHRPAARWPANGSTAGSTRLVVLSDRTAVCGLATSSQADIPVMIPLRWRPGKETQVRRSD
jgi:hypothetical protein